MLLLVALAAADAYVVYRLSRPDMVPLLSVCGETLTTAGVAAALRCTAESGLLGWLAVPVVGPLLLALLVGLLGGRRGSAGDLQTVEEGGPEGETAAPEPPPAAVGLRLLATLQEEARLIDFVREDIEGYSDAEIGSAVRGVHAALRKALDERLVLEPILAGEDGDRVEVPQPFDPALIRVTGKLGGGPPYRGLLRHGGWRARDVRLPAPTPGSDPTILMPAEVEVGAE
ncbi:MAG: DUF2760 domain-containing protein [Thermodesulfobacteriota bacterium]